MKYGYGRVSTKHQQKDGNSLECQEEALISNGAEKLYLDAFSGKTVDRPQLQELLSKLEDGDTLIVTKLDRFARSIGQASELIGNLIDRGVTVNVLNLGIMDNTPTSKLIRNVLLSFAEFEREMINERTSEGIAKKKENEPDWVQGRPKKLNIPQEYIDDVKSGKKSVAQACRELGICRSSWYNEMRRGVQIEIS